MKRVSDLTHKTMRTYTRVGCISVISYYVIKSRPGHDTLNVQVVKDTNVSLLRGYYVAALFQSNIWKLVPCHELVNVYCKPLRFREKK